jgi:hypothetical protein
MYSSETSADHRITRRYIPEDTICQRNNSFLLSKFNKFSSCGRCKIQHASEDYKYVDKINKNNSLKFQTFRYKSGKENSINMEIGNACM